MLGEEQILWDVVEEHLDEAEFLLEQWVSARTSPVYTLQELGDGPEVRLSAHVDALVVNGPLALQQIAWPALEQDDPHRLAAGALALMHSGDFRALDLLNEPETPEPEEPQSDEAGGGSDPDYPAELLDLERLPPPSADDEQERQAGLESMKERLAGMDPDDPERPAVAELVGLYEASAPEPEPETEPETEPAASDAPSSDGPLPGLTLALALCTHPTLDEQLRRHVAKADGPSLVMLLRACADRGLDPGSSIDRALDHADPEVVEAALRAAAFGDRRRLLARVEARLQHPSPAVRTAAMDTGLCWGSRSAWELAMHAFRHPGGRAAMVWMASLGDERHAQALIGLLDDESRRLDALWALGFCGRIPAIEACLQRLDDEDELVQRLAGEALAHMLGLDLEDDALWEEPAIDEPEPGTEGDTPAEDTDDLDAELAPQPEDDLPQPNATAIRELWARVQGGFTPGHRYLRGKPVGREGPGWILDDLSCRRVDVVAREVVARSSGVGRWPARVRVGVQRQAASALASLGRNPGALQGDLR